jgi:hypothetical protein
MAKQSRTLVSNITTAVADSTYSYGVKKKGAGYHISGDGVHTVIYDLDSFVGSIKIQATLAQYPGDNDWVDVVDTIITGDSSMFLDNTYTRTFTGKFIWVRAAYNLQNGTINEIRYNY